ncbi:MAG TPA: universal stress protein [Dehalococcoidia bacterium]|nr:universal stress protein [Dehalococcoidia bacterium]
MYRKMLVLLDGSELSEVVFSFAKELAARLNLDVVLLQVYGPMGRDFVPVHRAYIERAAETIKRQVKDVQNELSIPPKERKVKVRAELADGHYAEEILRFAEENKVDLILMASHGRSGIRRWRMGSVADKVLRASKVPVLFIRAGVEDAVPYDKWPTRAIVVPLDGSEMAESALPHAEALAKQRALEPVTVNFIRACDPPMAPTYYSPELSGVPLNWGEFMEQEMTLSKQSATEYLAKIAKQFEDKGIKTQSAVLVGKAADEIIDYATKNPFSIIVMTTHGRSGLSRLVFGSVTESVLQAVSNPILLTKACQADS